MSTDPRYFECTKGGSYKFWLVYIDEEMATRVHLWHGKIDTDGIHLVKDFDDADEAAEYVEEQIKQKLSRSKGYGEEAVPGVWESGSQPHNRVRNITQPSTKKRNQQSSAPIPSAASASASAAAASTSRKRQRNDDDDDDDDDDGDDDNDDDNNDDDDDDDEGNSGGGGGKPLSGMVFCVTGTVSVLRRTFLAWLTRHGGRVASSVTKDVTHVVHGVGEPETTKIAKARASGKAIIDEATVRALCGDADSVQASSSSAAAAAASFDESRPSRRFECTAGTANKFWAVQRVGSHVHVKYGRIGSGYGAVSTKDHGSVSAASAYVERMIVEKVKKGYAEVTDDDGVAATATSPSGVYFVGAIPDESTYDNTNETVVYDFTLIPLQFSVESFFQQLFASGAPAAFERAVLGGHGRLRDTYLRHLYDADDDRPTPQQLAAMTSVAAVGEYLKTRLLTERGVRDVDGTCILYGETREFEEEFAFFSPDDVSHERLGPLFNGRIVLLDNGGGGGGGGTPQLVAARGEGPAYLPSY